MLKSWNFIATLYLTIGVAFECLVYGPGNFAFGLLHTLFHIFLWPVFAVWVFWPWVAAAVFVFWAVNIIKQINFNDWKDLYNDLKNIKK